MTGTSDLFNIANSTTAVVGPTGTGAISGGLLRPGSIDQQAFQQMLLTQQQNREAAGAGGKPVAIPPLPFQNGIPTLTSAQFAALVGKTGAGPAPTSPTAAPSPTATGDAEETGPSTDPQAANSQAANPQAAAQPANPGYGRPTYGSTTYGTDLAKQIAAGHAYAKLAAAAKSGNAGNGMGNSMGSQAAPAAMLPPSALPRSAAIRLSGTTASQIAATTMGASMGATTTTPSENQPRIFRGPAGVRPVGAQSPAVQAVDPQGNTQTAAVDVTTNTPSSTDPAGAAPSNAPKPDAKPSDAADSQDKAPSDPNLADPNLVHLKEQPDRDMQMKLRLEHKQWVVDETPGSRQLFFGADGKFGWDDFLDVINPLQHIPIVSQIYRAVTGDEINGAAELIGAIPLGPIGFLGMAGAIADLAVKDATGEDIGENVANAIFGDSGSATDNMAAKPGSGSPAGKSPAGDATADEGSGPASIETASIAEFASRAEIQRGRPG